MRFLVQLPDLTLSTSPDCLFCKDSWIVIWHIKKLGDSMSTDTQADLLLLIA